MEFLFEGCKSFEDRSSFGIEVVLKGFGEILVGEGLDVGEDFGCARGELIGRVDCAAGKTVELFVETVDGLALKFGGTSGSSSVV